VLRLLAADRTNAQIGAELYISPKTASVHVTSILRKLGVSGRVQVAALIGVPRELGARRPTKSNAPRWPPRQRRLAATGHSLTAACMRRCAGQRRFSRGLAVWERRPARRIRGEVFGTHDLTAADSRTYRATLQVRLGAFRSRERHGAVRETTGDGRRARSGARQRSARAPEATWVPAGGGSQEQSLHGRPHRRRSASGYPDVRYCRDEALPPGGVPGPAAAAAGRPPNQDMHP